jgi:hypothetical protein
VRFRVIRFVVDALSFSSLLAFIITDNSWAFDTYRLSLFDISVGTRLVQQVQMSSSYKSTNPLLIVGSLPSSSRPPALHPKGYDVLGSGLDNSGSAAALLRTLGLKFSLPTEATLDDCEQIVKSATPVAVSSTCSAIDLSKI